jgi:hypothetical protein
MRREEQRVSTMGVQLMRKDSEDRQCSLTRLGGCEPALVAAQTGSRHLQEATQLWLENWRRGDRQVNAYREAALTATRQAC